MKLYTFEVNQQRRLGAEIETGLVDLQVARNAFVAAQAAPPGKLRAMPSEILSFIRLGALSLEAARETLAFIRKRPAVPVGEQLLYSFDSLRLAAPLPGTGKIISGRPAPENSKSAEPVFSVKLPNTVIGPGAAVICPKSSRALEYTVELVAVIGKRARGISESDATGRVFGYTMLSNIIARDLAATSGDDLIASNFDGFCPMGPFIVTADDATLPDTPLPRLIAYLSHVMTLEPGDLICTPVPGTPSRISSGEPVTAHIQGIGNLINPAVSEE